MIAPLIDHLWQSTLVAAAAGLLVLALRKHAASVRYWVWLAASVKFVVPFAALVAIGNSLEWRAAAVAPASPSAVTEWITAAEQVAQPMAALATAIAPAAIVAAPDARTAFAALAGAVWLGGLAVVLGVWFHRGLRLSRLVRSATKLTDGAFAGLGIDVRLSSSKVEPGIVGIFRPVLLVPEGILQRLSAQQLDAVIRHELCHVRRRDNLTAAVHMAIEAVFWFHPLVWWIGARLIEERERACDEAVVASGADPHAYAEGILEVCRLYVESPLACAAGVGGGATLKSRVRRLAERWASRTLSPAWSAVLAIVPALVLGAPVVIGAATAPRALAQPATAGRPAFESASIAAGVDGSAQTVQMRGRVFELRNHSLRQMVAFAYDIQDAKVDERNVAVSRRYTITATARRRWWGGLPDYRAMLRTLLEERFELEAHRETQRMPALVLGRAPNGESRLPDPETFAMRRYIRADTQSFEAVNLPLRTVTDWFSLIFRKPVVDETSLGSDDDVYSFKVQWPRSSETPGSPAHLTALSRVLEEQIGLSLSEAERDIERVVVDRVAEPADIAAAPPDLKAPRTAQLDRYAGYYAVFAIDWIVSVERDGDHLVAKVFAEPARELYARSETTFFAKAPDTEVTFDVDDQGAVRGLVMRRDGRDVFAARVDADAARARLATLERRIEAQAPTPGGEELMRRIANDLAAEGGAPAGEPPRDWAAMLRGAMNRDIPGPFAQRGPLQSVAFKSIAPTGRDVYEIAFESLRIEVFVGLNDDGGLMSLNYRPIAPPSLR
jgi:uncharacterized protein (TIGR03435 family)